MFLGLEVVVPIELVAERKTVFFADNAFCRILLKTYDPSFIRVISPASSGFSG
jgi:hypothetical protein